MTAKNRIVAIRLADRIQRNRAYAEKVGISVEMKNTKKTVNEKKDG